MKLYLVKSEAVKCRYFFQDEAKALELFQLLLADNEDVTLKFLKTSDEWTIEQLVQHYETTKSGQE